MTRVFIGGSRNISKLSPAVLERLDNIIKQGFTVLIGDANGADKAVQSYLATKTYPYVIVFCTNGICRNNLGAWQIQAVAAGGARGGFEFYTRKDAAMAQQADYGFMLWDAKSKGTLNNLLNLIGKSAAALVYLATEGKFYKIRAAHDLQLLLEKCAASDRDKLTKELPISTLLYASSENFLRQT